MEKYEFGDLVVKNNVPCYKIDRGGKITCYLSMVDRKTNKEVTYESNLVLSKSKDISG